MINKFIGISFIFSVFISFGLSAQIQTEDYNKHSVRPVKKQHQMLKRTLWWRIDLRQKINVGFFAENNEITRLIIDGVKKGKINPYKNDSLMTRLSMQQFLERLQLPIVEELEELDTSDDDAEWGTPTVTAANVDVETPDEYLPRQLFVLELKEDRIFDKMQSRMVHDIQAITIIIPGSQTNTGLDLVLGSFSYKELAENLFKDNPNAIWYNMQNAAEHRNLAHAFDMRLFDGKLVKFNNPRDNSIIDMYKGGRRAAMMSERAIHKMIEEEVLLWSY